MHPANTRAASNRRLPLVARLFPAGEPFHNAPVRQDPHAPDTRVAEAVAASGVKVESCVRTGVMLFTFRDCSEAPMRVSVYEASVDGGQTIGLFHAPEEVPYERMWADDKVWLPHVLEEGPYFFSGHFVFSGPPPGKLVAHNCRGERCGGLSFWE